MQISLGIGGALLVQSVNSSEGSAFRNQDQKQRQNNGSHYCEICGHKFLWRWMLSRHMMTHTGEKPHACPLCDYKAARKEQVKNHFVNRHRGALTSQM